MTPVLSFIRCMADPRVWSTADANLTTTVYMQVSSRHEFLPQCHTLSKPTLLMSCKAACCSAACCRSCGMSIVDWLDTS
eukprot:4131395-Pleurochrysis_carterae.AAC.1